MNVPHRLPYRADLDGLRGIAVLLVIAHHAFPDSVPGGFIGVDIFFVLSGYLITRILLSDFAAPGARPFAVLGEFYGRRVRRIFPSLAVVLLFCGALGSLFLLPSEFAALGQHILAGAGFCLNLVVAGQTGYFESEALQRPLLHLWSLGIEEQFYLIWPLFVAPWAARRGNLLPFTVFLAALSFFWNDTKPEASYAVAFYLPHLRGWELLLGATVAVAEPANADRRGHPKEALLSAIGVGLIALGLVLIKPEPVFPDRRCLLPVVGTACLIHAGAQAWAARRLLAQRCLVAIGLISFPLYLWHWPLLAFGRLLWPSAPGLTVWLAIAAAFILAILTYRFVERPLRHGARGRRKIVFLAGTMAALGTAGWAVTAARGLPSRFPPFIRDLAALDAEEQTRSWRRGVGYVDFGQDERAFQRDPTPIDPRKPTLYLWGDSHAAQLYPGCVARWGATHNIVQRTAAAVPPLLVSGKSGRFDAADINAYILAEIPRLRPDLVMLAAAWSSSEWRDLGVTVERLRALGVRRIVVIGPTPRWPGGLPQHIMNHHRRHRADPVPRRFRSGWSPEPLAVDAELAALCRSLGVEYVSPCRILGNDDGFLARLGDSADTITAFDYGHLTEAGSRYLVSHFPDWEKMVR